MAVEKEGFASRWSRRKQEVAKETTVEDAPITTEEPVIDEATLAEQKLEKLNALTDEDMPDIETLNEDSDFSGFMSTGVSETLRKMALQKLFHGKSYNVRDGLDEYDGDYTSFEKLDPSVITCDMKHLLEVEAEKLLAEEKEKEEAERLAQAEIDEDGLDDVDLEMEDVPEEIAAESTNDNLICKKENDIIHDDSHNPINNNESETGEEMALIDPSLEGINTNSNKNEDVA